MNKQITVDNAKELLVVGDLVRLNNAHVAFPKALLKVTEIKSTTLYPLEGKALQGLAAHLGIIITFNWEDIAEIGHVVDVEYKLKSSVWYTVQ